MLEYELNTSSACSTIRECHVMEEVGLKLTVKNGTSAYDFTNCHCYVKTTIDGVEYQENKITIEGNVLTVYPLNVNFVRTGGTDTCYLVIGKFGSSPIKIEFKLKVNEVMVSDKDILDLNKELQTTIGSARTTITQSEQAVNNSKTANSDLQLTINQAKELKKDLDEKEIDITKNVLKQVAIGARNLAVESDSIGKYISSFDGSDNKCLDLGVVLVPPDAKIGDSLTVQAKIDYNSLNTVSGKTPKFLINGYGDVTNWNDGCLTFDTVNFTSNNGTIHYTSTIILTADHLKNSYWTTQVRFDGIEYASVHVSCYQVESGTIKSAFRVSNEKFKNDLDEEINQTIEKINSNKTDIDNLKTRVSSLEEGGNRNLLSNYELKNTDYWTNVFDKNLSISIDSQQFAYKNVIKITSPNVESGSSRLNISTTTYTSQGDGELVMSFWAKASTNLTILVYFESNSTPYKRKVTVKKDTWNEYTIGLDAVYSNGGNYLNIQFLTAGTLYISDPKLEHVTLKKEIASMRGFLLDYNHPIGTVYLTTDASFNPSVAWGGTWVNTAQGRALVGVGTGKDGNGDTLTVTSKQTGGEYKHALSVSEMPAHKHNIQIEGYNLEWWSPHYYTATRQGGGIQWGNDRPSNESKKDVVITNTGGNGRHNNIMPYYGVCIWERTA